MRHASLIVEDPKLPRRAQGWFVCWDKRNYDTPEFSHFKFDAAILPKEKAMRKARELRKFGYASVEVVGRC